MTFFIVCCAYDDFSESRIGSDGGDQISRPSQSRRSSLGVSHRVHHPLRGEDETERVTYTRDERTHLDLP